MLQKMYVSCIIWWCYTLFWKSLIHKYAWELSVFPYGFFFYILRIYLWIISSLILYDNSKHYQLCPLNSLKYVHSPNPVYMSWMYNLLIYTISCICLFAFQCDCEILTRTKLRNTKWTLKMFNNLYVDI